MKSPQNQSRITEPDRPSDSERRALHRQFAPYAFRHWQTWLALALAVAIPQWSEDAGAWLVGSNRFDILFFSIGWLVGFGILMRVGCHFTSKYIREAKVRPSVEE